MTKTQSVEPNIADLANGWLKSYKLDYLNLFRTN